MKVGYVVPVIPSLASYRLRVAIPAPHIGYPYVLSGRGDVSFFFKNGNVNLARLCPEPIVFDVVNDHFTGPNAAVYQVMCDLAHQITTASEAMAERVLEMTGRGAVVIPDPYETDEQPVRCEGDGVAWFGHAANGHSLAPYIGTHSLVICSNIPGTVPWTPENQSRVLKNAAVVLLTGSNPGASANRFVTALRAGRFVVSTGGVPAWSELSEFGWIGNVQKGIEWALNNREEACQRVTAGQAWIRQRFSPKAIGQQWGQLFGSILERETSERKAGSESTPT
jgi:hypothetical protein